MAYRMYRVFCGSPGDVEPELQTFYKTVGDFNANYAMPLGVLFVSLALPGTTLDKRPYQAVIGENIRSCRYYVQLLEDTWGPVERSFERDHALAVQCAADPSMPMQEVAIFFKKPLLPHQVDPRVAEFKDKLREAGECAEFSSPAEFASLFEPVLHRWLVSVTQNSASA